MYSSTSSSDVVPSNRTFKTYYMFNSEHVELVEVMLTLREQQRSEERLQALERSPLGVTNVSG